MRAAFLLALALLGTLAEASAHGTQAYFTSTVAPSGTMTTVHLDVTTSSTASGLFDIASNMVPGDFDIKTIDIVNHGTVGESQQDFTYAVASTSLGAGNWCSKLDAADAPTCASPQTAAVPGASATTGAALLLVRCTSDAAASVPVACSSANVYVKQVYPVAGAGLQQQLAGGLTRAVVGGVASGSSYAIDIAGQAFTGGPVLVTSAVALGGPDAVVGADSQTTGLAAGHTDHLASIVYLPTQAGPALADQTSILTFTWTARQRLGGTRT